MIIVINVGINIYHVNVEFNMTGMKRKAGE